MHLAVDADTGEIVATGLTGRRTHDRTRVPILLEQINNRVASVTANGAYDAEGVCSGGRKERNRNILGMPYSYRVG